MNLVEDVLDPAGISIGSFYHQFTDKTELLREILSEAAARRRAFIAGLGDLDEHPDMVSSVRAVVDRLYESLEQDGPAWRLQRATRIAGAGAEVSGRDDWTDGLAERLAVWFAAPVGRRRKAAEMVLTFARGAIFDFIDTPPERRISRAAWVDGVATFIAGGLTAMLGQPR